jgi:hypothetical protein
MTQAFEKLKALLDENGSLSDEDIATVTSEHGELTSEENILLLADLHERMRTAQQSVTMDQFLEANKILDTADPGSEEYRRAQKIVDDFLAGN